MGHLSTRCFFLAGLLALSCLRGRSARAQQAEGLAHRPVELVVGRGEVDHPPVREVLAWAGEAQPVYLLNGQLIIGATNLAALDPQAIAHIDVYKGGPATPARWRSLAPHGIIALTMKPGFRLNTIASKSLEQIRQEVGQGGVVGFELDGLPLEDHALRVATAAIATLDVRGVAVQRGALNEYIINIRLVRQSPRPPKPGIYIRGTERR